MENTRENQTTYIRIISPCPALAAKVKSKYYASTIKGCFLQIRKIREEFPAHLTPYSSENKYTTPPEVEKNSTDQIKQ